MQMLVLEYPLSYNKQGDIVLFKKTAYSSFLANMC